MLLPFDITGDDVIVDDNDDGNGSKDNEVCRGHQPQSSARADFARHPWHDISSTGLPSPFHSRLEPIVVGRLWFASLNLL